MGQALDKHGDVLGEAYGDTRREVLEKLEAAHPGAAEVRIRASEDRPAAVDRAYEARREAANAGQVTPGNGDARTQAIPTGAGNAAGEYDPIAEIIRRFRRLDPMQRFKLSRELALETASQVLGKSAAGELSRELDVLERSLRESSSGDETKGRERSSARRMYHERHGLVGSEPEEIGLNNVEDLFRYQGWNEDQTQRGDVVRELLVASARGILRNVPLGPGRDMALRQLMIVRMVCNQAITFNGRI